MANQGLVCSILRLDAGLNAGVPYMPGTSDAFFTTAQVGKGVVCQDRAYFGSGRRVGGWEWERGNPKGYPFLCMWGFGLHCATSGCVCGCVELVLGSEKC